MKHPMLSWSHAISVGYKTLFADSLCTLPNNTPAALCQGLMKAHRKLSDYYGKSDESPYYTWVLCMLSILEWYAILLMKSLVLDPRTFYSGLLADCSDNLDARAHLKFSKEQLHAHFCAKYDNPVLTPTTPVVSTSASNISPQKVDFTSHYWNLHQA